MTIKFSWLEEQKHFVQICWRNIGTESMQEEISAMVIETEITEEDEMNLFTSLQTDTYKYQD